MPATTPKPNKANAISSQNGNERPQVKFVRQTLSSDQKTNLAIWAAETKLEDVLKWLQTQVMVGITVSLRSNDSGFQCSLTGTDRKSDRYGQVLVARASTPIKALYSAMFRDEVLLKHMWPIYDSEEDFDL